MNAPLTIVNPQSTRPEAEHTRPNAPALCLDPRTFDRALSCVHCGLCLPACPTYTQTGHEADSPRGRIQLMRGLAEGTIPVSGLVTKHLDLCLDCRGCETACPSGVIYHELIEETRIRFGQQQKLTAQGRMMRWVFFNIFAHARRLKLALLGPRMLQKLGIYRLLRRSGVFRLLPQQFQKMEQMLPSDGPLWPRALRPHTTAGGTDALIGMLHGQKAPSAKWPKARVGFFGGCIGSVMYQHVNEQAVRLLAAAGADVVAPRQQVCCGAIHHHNADQRTAEEMARCNIDTFLPENGSQVDWIVTNIAGCGAMLREYDVLLRDDNRYAGRAREFAHRVRDISEVLLELGLPPMRHRVDKVATYHDACHLAHAQKVVAPPRQLLSKVPGLKLIALADSDMCCGAAGTYNLTQPEMSRELAARKLQNIAATGADICITGNVGCAMQIQSEADARGMKLEVMHPVELLYRGVFGEQ